MKFLFLTEAHPPSPVYAESRHASELVAALAKAGHCVCVISADSGPSSPAATGTSPDVERTGGRWPFFHYEADSNAVLDALGLLGCGLQGGRSGSPPSAIVAYGWPRALAAFVLRERTGAPVFVHLHGTTRGRVGGDLDAGAQYRAEMEAWAAQSADAVLCPSEPVRDEVVAHCGAESERVHVLPMACARERLHPADTNLSDFRALLSGPDELLVLFAGRLTAENAPGALVRGMPEVLDQGVAMRAVFAGDGDQAAELMSRATETGVADRCFFAGQVADRVLSCLYACADVLACPGRYCPSGVSAVEAMALGIPVIGSDAGALRGIVKDGRNGLHVCPDDPDALSGALVWLAKRRERLAGLGKEAARTAAQTTSWEASAGLLVGLVEHLAPESQVAAQSSGG